MQDFVKMAAAILGTTEEVARAATSSVLDVIARAAPAADVQALFARLPGAADLLRAVTPTPPAPPPPPPRGSTAGVIGAVGDLMTNAATTLQGAIGTGAAFLHLLGQFGLDPRRATQFVGLFVDFARQQAGTELVDRIIATIPGARQVLAMLGSSSPKP
jgi:hypothetical protein